MYYVFVFIIMYIYTVVVFIFSIYAESSLPRLELRSSPHVVDGPVEDVLLLLLCTE